MNVSQSSAFSDDPAREVSVECRRSRAVARGFTLIEMLVVLAIIGIIAGISIGPISKLMKNAGMPVAQRQLRDVFAYARNVALSQRSTVYVVFVSPEITDSIANPTNQWAGNDFILFNRGVGAQGTGYALYVKRKVGEQPGRNNPEYLTDWEYLPQNVFVHSNELYNVNHFKTELLRYPISGSTNQVTPVVGGKPNYNVMTLPFVAFDPRGQLASGKDALIPLSEGSILRTLNLDGTYRHVLPNVVEQKRRILSGQIIPGVLYYVRYNSGDIDYNGNLIAAGESFVGETSVANFSIANGAPRVDIFEGIHINWLTGRAKIRRPELK